jgi:hypothetical protein
MISLNEEILVWAQLRDLYDGKVKAFEEARGRAIHQKYTLAALQAGIQKSSDGMLSPEKLEALRTAVVRGDE